MRREPVSQKQVIFTNQWQWFCFKQHTIEVTICLIFIDTSLNSHNYSCKMLYMRCNVIIYILKVNHKQK